MFSTNLFQIIKDRSDILEVARYFNMNLNSKYMCRCPFHNEKTASLSINPKKQIWKCFGCGKGGDVINLVEESLQCTPFEAIQKLNVICNCGLDFTLDKTKPKFEYDKDYARYKTNKKKENKKKKEISELNLNIYEAACTVYKYWNNLLKYTKKLDIELFEEELSIIYKNESYFDGLVDILDNCEDDFIYKNKNILIETIERGIIFMDFEKISLIAFKEENMPDSCSNSELIAYYRLKELYIKHYRKQINDEEAKKEKQKIKGMYEKQTSLDNFYKSLHQKISDNIRLGENNLIKLSKMMNNNASEKELLNVAIDCIYRLTDDIMLVKMYKEKY